MFINVEELHARWLEEMRDFAWEYQGKKHGVGMCHGLIFQPDDDNDSSEFIFKARGVFDLPKGSSNLCLYMARFAKCSLPLDQMIGSAIKELPEATFCLQSILQAAFPRNVETGIFKPYDGALGSEIDDPESVSRHAHNAFAGLGVIIMEAARAHLAELATDSDIMKKADGMFLSIIE